MKGDHDFPEVDDAANSVVEGMEGGEEEDGDEKHGKEC